MTLRELKTKVDAAVSRLRNNEDDIIVAIPNGKPSMGARAMTTVITAHQGYGWEKSIFIINPIVPMAERVEENKYIKDDSRNHVLGTSENNPPRKK